MGIVDARFLPSEASEKWSSDESTIR